MEEYPDIRKQLEGDGYILTDEEYAYNLSYARRKAQLCGKGEGYIPLLLPDVIRQFLLSSYINAVSMARMFAGK